MRSKTVVINSSTSLLLQLVTVICGFILPRLMLRSFGSEINGAVSSITHFLGYISFMEAGVGGVIRAALYKPLAESDLGKVNAIVNAAQSFFRKLSFVFIGYVLLLSILFKYISNTGLRWTFLFLLVWIQAIHTFVQYYSGMMPSILLKADQKEYINLLLQAGSILLNTLVSVILLKAGCGVHIVKLVSAGVYILRPLLLNRIARQRYQIDKTIMPDNNAIRQRWNGFGHNLAYYIHHHVDNVVVTMMLGLRWASVYSVYYMVITGVNRIVGALTSGSEVAFGNMIAQNEQKVLRNRFQIVETLSSMIITAFFTVTGLLVTDFIRIYTRGIDDVNYLILSVGILFVISEALHCIKQNYHNLVLAAGHYKETQRGAFIEAGLNLGLSVILAAFMGLPGILLATIIATLYRIFDYIFYLRENILHRGVKIFLKRQFINISSAVSIVMVCSLLPFSAPTNYGEWIIKAVPIFIIAGVITLLFNLLFYRRDVIDICLKLKRVLSDARPK